MRIAPEQKAHWRVRISDPAKCTGVDPVRPRVETALPPLIAIKWVGKQRLDGGVLTRRKSCASRKGCTGENKQSRRDQGNFKQHLPCQNPELSSERTLDVAIGAPRQQKRQYNQPRLFDACETVNCIIIAKDIERPMPQVKRVRNQAHEDGNPQTQCVPDKGLSPRARIDHQSGTNTGQERRRSWKQHSVVKKNNRQTDHPESRNAENLTQ